MLVFLSFDVKRS